VLQRQQQKFEIHVMKTGLMKVYSNSKT